MKEVLRKLCSPILKPLEAGDEKYITKPSHRKILIAIGILFCFLATTVAILTPREQLGYLFPALVFYGAGLTALIVGALGSDKAVAKIWGSK